MRLCMPLGRLFMKRSLAVHKPNFLVTLFGCHLFNTSENPDFNLSEMFKYFLVSFDTGQPLIILGYVSVSCVILNM